MSDPRVSNPFATPNPASGPLASPATVGVRPDARLAQAFLTQAFLWMFIGLIVSAGVAYFVQANDRLLDFAASNILLLFIGQLALVVAIGWGINRISATIALGLFFIYAATLGLTIGLIVSAYTGSSVVTAFLSASAMFGAAAIYGHVTKRSLASLGGILFMALIGLIVASVLNIFLANGALGWVISIAGVVIFTALTAYDVQRIQNGDLAIATGSMEKAAVLGALHLYLDFVNLFLFLLRLFGNRN
ncbi:MAG TPA: Bax inhibitor-1/YccA family protein [Candidatus Limnocylindrales bacterium]|jgi:FtsH-binding integral membrane protein|nr:Bax inhibitor-1/YccA family protein [Candidatus Limnocylindrales bacterium]